MMNYELFKEVVAEKFKDYLPEQFANMELSVKSVEKVNRSLDSLHFSGGEGNMVTPTIYINDMYNKYLQNENLEEVLQNSAVMLENAMEEVPMVGAIDFDTAKDNIVFQLINTEQNIELLSGVPNREFQDLSIMYRWVIKTDETGIQSTIVKDALAEKLGMSEEQLFKAAVENTKRIFPPVVKSMNDVIRDMFMKDGMPGDIVDMMIGEMPAEQTMWVISNERGINGAVSMLYEDKLNKLATDLDNDLYIMPSSVHEVIAVSTSMGDPNELAQMVAEINMDQVSLDERLSNQVYHYDKDLRKLSLATNTPNKRLDGVVAEPKQFYEAEKLR